MNKLISFIAINLVSLSLLAQTVNDIPIKDIDVEYIQIVGAAKFFSTKVVVGIDFGQRTKYFKMGNTIVKDEYGKPVEFNSMIDALNFMTKNGFEFVTAYAVTIYKQNVYHYLMRNRKNEIFEKSVPPTPANIAIPSNENKTILEPAPSFESKITLEILKDIDGNSYRISQIGNKKWMAENLKVSRFRNGDLIPGIESDIKWSDAKKGARCIYDNSPNYGKLLGNLYNGYVILDGRNICPVGWHLPSDSEWEMLIKTMGGVNEASVKLKATKGWSNELNGTNSSGMNVLPSGSRNESGQFVGAGKVGIWWSNTKDPSGLKIWTRTLTNDKQEVGRFASNPQIGGYIRCVQD